MTLGSLFAGIGGFDLGFERAGFTTTWQVENDKTCRQVLKTHFPHAERQHDVTDSGRASLAAVDLIAGGFPCQDVSIAGRRAGLAGKRSGLWFQFARILGELRPRWAVIENTPGLLSVDDGAGFLAVLRGLAEFGYLSAWRVLDAQYFGVPQHRERVFIVGCLGSGAAAEVLFEPAGLSGDPPSRRTPGEDLAGTLGSHSANGGSRTTDLDGHGAYITSTLRSRSPADMRGGEVPGLVVSPAVTAKWAKGSAGPAGDECQNLVIAQNQRGELRTMERAGTLGGPGGQAGQGYQAVLIDPTLRVGGREQGAGDSYDNTPITEQDCRIRRLTPLECERLQGFPDDWTEGHADTPRYRMLGNAVAVPVAEWIARRIAAADALLTGKDP